MLIAGRKSVSSEFLEIFHKSDEFQTNISNLPISNLSFVQEHLDLALAECSRRLLLVGRQSGQRQLAREFSRRHLESSCSRLYTDILMICDRFPRWPEHLPLPREKSRWSSDREKLIFAKTERYFRRDPRGIYSFDHRLIVEFYSIALLVSR